MKRRIFLVIWGVGLILGLGLTTTLKTCYAADHEGIMAYPPFIIFGDVKVKSKSPNTDVIILNRGDTKIKIHKIEVDGTNKADFRIIKNKCRKRALAPGRACRFGIFFRPGAEGERKAFVKVESSGELGKLKISLIGWGIKGAKPPLIRSFRAKPNPSLIGVAVDYNWKTKKGTEDLAACGIIFDAQKIAAKDKGKKGISVEDLYKELFSSNGSIKGSSLESKGFYGGDFYYEGPFYGGFYYLPLSKCKKGNIVHVYPQRGLKWAVFGVRDKKGLTALRNLIVDIRAPDLTCTWQTLKVKQRGKRFYVLGRLLVQNIGDPLDKPRKIEVTITWPEENNPIKKKVTLTPRKDRKVLKLKRRYKNDPTGGLITAEVDPNDEIMEQNENNNKAERVLE